MKQLRQYIRKLISENYVPASKAMLESVYIYESYNSESLTIGFFNKSLIDDFLGSSVLQPTQIGKWIAEDINSNNSGGGERVFSSKEMKFVFQEWDFEDPIAAKRYGSNLYKGDGWKIYAAIDGMIHCDVIPENPNVFKVTYTATHAGTGFGPILKDYALSLLGDKIMMPDRGKKTVGRGRNKVEIPSVSDAALGYYRYIRDKQEYGKYEVILMDDEKLQITKSKMDDVPLHYPETSFLEKSGLKRYPALYHPSMGDLSNIDLYDIGLRIKKPILFSNDNGILKKAFTKWDAIFHEFGEVPLVDFNSAMMELLDGYFGVVYKKERYKGAVRKVQ